MLLLRKSWDIRSSYSVFSWFLSKSSGLLRYFSHVKLIKYLYVFIFYSMYMGICMCVSAHMCVQVNMHVYVCVCGQLFALCVFQIAIQFILWVRVSHFDLALSDLISLVNQFALGVSFLWLLHMCYITSSQVFTQTFRVKFCFWQIAFLTEASP